MDLMLSRGIAIPEDVCITGFDNLPSCTAVTPPLTSVSQNFDQMGKIAFHTVLDRIQKKGVLSSRVVPTSIVMRDSLTENRN